jgi:hypothetical protein
MIHLQPTGLQHSSRNSLPQPPETSVPIGRWKKLGIVVMLGFIIKGVVITSFLVFGAVEYLR